MNIIINRFELVRAIAAVFCVVVVASAALAADAAATQDCRSIADNALRLACYDRLASPPARPPEPPAPEAAAVIPTAAAEAAPIPAAAAEAAPIAKELPKAEAVPLDDEIGRETLRRDDQEEQPVIRGRVVRCHENSVGKYLFYFDNGQIWKQKDNTRIRWSVCQFDVTLSKDFFGYKMVREGEKHKVRIARVK